MQLASTGARALKPTGGGAFLHSTPARSIHIPSFAPRPNAGQATSTAQTLFKQTRTFLSRFVAHLTTPGTLRQPVHAPARHIFTGRMPSIQQGLSLSARLALSRPLKAPHLPRPPTIPPSTTQVGLGLARNFSTARPVFQSLAENVPVAGRAFFEADWDVKVNKERERFRLQKAAKRKAQKAKSHMKPLRDATKKISVAEEKKEELDHYFPEAPAPVVTTHLLIPLAPTEAVERLPLSAQPAMSSAHPLLPLPFIAAMHSAHNTHSLRVSSLFARLDAAHVFEMSGIRYEAHGDPTGLCTLLEIIFEGWDEARVRSVIGEAGRGWCVIDEVREDQEQEEEKHVEEMLEVMSEASSEETPWHQSMNVDPARSLVLPTLDFSASFLAPPSDHPYSSVLDSGMSTPLSDLEFHNAWMSVERADARSDAVSDARFSSHSAESSWVGGQGFEQDARPLDFVSASDSWLGFGFSSEFSGRMQEAEGPREQVF
ncbi:hypothetical protein WOLCODRAFT_136250 [Wolfiporia cocos MD-104 SS10]|uniref:Uncharacterized protein n=1 Tax=Wolfiporia cocos (strain MD-104) TaxID=742152 RepID=A0A2H3J853_WOLCO|nr:hypothetical protein WOLCODRAFT_136250 [Wolfiporia cocos MD-104 SS10]